MSENEIHRSIEVEAPPAEVWELLVDDEERAGWFGGDTTLTPTPGGDADFTEPDGTRRRGTVEEVDPDRRLSWVWWPDGDEDGASRVRVDLTPTPSGTRISIVEVPLAPVARASALASVGGPTLDLELRLLVRACLVG